MPAIATPEEVLTFWFGHADPTAPPTVEQARWWTSSAAFDAEILSRFGATMTAAAEGTLDRWLETPASALALVLVCDQFPRNVYRGTPEAFARDAQARRVARHIEGRGWVPTYDLSAAAFALMPFEHSESLADQQHSVEAFTALSANVREQQQAYAHQLVTFAVKHHDIVARFGRFPHRNAAMGRAPTAEETAWLAGGGDRFGQ